MSAAELPNLVGSKIISNETAYCHTRSTSSVGTKNDFLSGLAEIKVRNLRELYRWEIKKTEIQLTRGNEVCNVVARVYSPCPRKNMGSATQVRKSCPRTSIASSPDDL